MMVLVDTTVWSLALRRDHDQLSALEKGVVKHWTTLVEENRVVIIGPIRQEILSGVRSQSDFRRLQDTLTAFPHFRIIGEDYNRAAEFYNLCRKAGVAATSIDMLLCAVASRAKISVFTTDRDFTHYAKCLPVQLAEVP